MSDNIRKEQPTQPSRKGFYASLTGTIVVALCCFTRILVVTLGAIGLSAFAAYLDYVLFPGLAVLITLTFLSYRRWRKASDSREN